MTTLVERIQQGKFFIVPGRHCEWCDVRPVCHLTHPASARRAREDYKQTHAHRDLRHQQPPMSHLFAIVDCGLPIENRE